MAYGNMTPAVTGTPASSAANNQIITNVDDLDTRLDTVETTVNATGSTGAGNSTLSTRLGTGVTTGSTATAQFTAVTGRATALETLTGGAVNGNVALGTLLGTVDSRTTNTSGNVGIGNQRLSDRLGAGVDNTTNVTSGTATAQLTDIRARIGAAQTASPSVADRLGSLEAAAGTSAVASVLSGAATPSIPANVFTSIPWASAPVNAPSTMWVVGSPTRITIPTGGSGLYLISFNFTLSTTGLPGGTSSMCATGVLINNTTLVRIGATAVVSGFQAETGAQTVLSLVAGNFIEAQVYQNFVAATAQTIAANTGRMTVKKLV